MNSRIIEARAVISADDQASAKIAAMAKRINEVTKAQALVNRAGGQELLAMAKQVDDLQSKLAKVQGFRQLARDVDQSAIAMRRANQEAARLKSAFDQARQIDAASRATRQLGRDYEVAARAAQQAQNAFRSQGQALRETRTALEMAGMPINRLATVQRNLEERTKAATAALERQKQAVSQSQVARAGQAGVATPPPRSPTTHVAPSAIDRLGTIAPTVGSGFAAKSAYDRAIAFERSVNASEARGELSKERANELRRNARNLGAEGLGFTALQVSELQRAYVQAGFENSADALALPTMRFSSFGEVDPFKAADYTVSALSAYRIKPKTKEEAVAAATRYQDIAAKGANLTRVSVDDFAQGFKFAAPLASALGVSMEQLAAMIATQGQSGIGGNESGVAVRSMLTRMVRPTADSRQALAEMGMKFEDYAKETKPITVPDLLSGLRAVGVDASKLKDQLPGIIKGAEASGGDASTELSQAIIKGLGITGVQDQNKISKQVARYVSSLGEAFDVDRFFADLQSRGVTPGQVSRIFDAKQGTRLMTIMLDDRYQGFERILREESKGASERGAQKMNQGVVGAHNRLVSAYDNFVLSLADSGVLESAAKGLDAVASGLRTLSDVSPRLLEFGTYAAMATASLGPLAIAVSKLAGAAGRVAGLMGVTGATATGAGAAVGAASRIPAFARFGAYGLAGYAAYEGANAIAGVASGIGHIAAGKYYTPTDAAGAADLRMQVAEIDAKIEGIRARLHPSMAGMPNADIDRLSGERQDLINRLSNIKAVVEDPVDVTGKVLLDGKADVNVTVRVQGEGRVTGMSATSTGHVRANAGTAMSEFDTP